TSHFFDGATLTSSRANYGSSPKRREKQSSFLWRGHSWTMSRGSRARTMNTLFFILARLKRLQTEVAQRNYPSNSGTSWRVQDCARSKKETLNAAVTL